MDPASDLVSIGDSQIGRSFSLLLSATLGLIWKDKNYKYIVESVNNGFHQPRYYYVMSSK